MIVTALRDTANWLSPSCWQRLKVREMDSGIRNTADTRPTTHNPPHTTFQTTTTLPISTLHCSGNNSKGQILQAAGSRQWGSCRPHQVAKRQWFQPCLTPQTLDHMVRHNLRQSEGIQLLEVGSAGSPSGIAGDEEGVRFGVHCCCNGLIKSWWQGKHMRITIGFPDLNRGHWCVHSVSQNFLLLIPFFTGSLSGHLVYQ